MDPIYSHIHDISSHWSWLESPLKCKFLFLFYKSKCVGWIWIVYSWSNCYWCSTAWTWIPELQESRVQNKGKEKSELQERFFFFFVDKPNDDHWKLTQTNKWMRQSLNPDQDVGYNNFDSFISRVRICELHSRVLD